MAAAKRSLRQASETSNGGVEILCFACRRAPGAQKQQSLTGFFKPNTGPKEEASKANGTPDVNDGSDDGSLQCTRCLRVMQQPTADRSGGGGPSSARSRVLPQIARLRQYQRVAAEQSVPWAIGEAAAAALMNEPCVCCGEPAPTEGHGLTRLRVWPDGLERPARGGFMGPFHSSNLATACGTCNLMKGYRGVRGYVEACRTVASHRGEGVDFGRYPHRFRNNTSKRSRSCYITASSTHSKTHALSNEQFNAIVGRPCHYCGKESDPPRHHNGVETPLPPFPCFSCVGTLPPPFPQGSIGSTRACVCTRRPRASRAAATAT